MSYQKQNFANGEVLSASQLNHIEDGIVDVESSANATKAVVDKIIDPTLSLSGKAADAKATGDAVGQIKEDVAAITPDDTAVDGKPWTSKKIVDSLCQKFEEMGNPVQCYPVENYPLGVKIRIEPKQAGEGDPSPENVRPITGMIAVQVVHSNDSGIEKAYDITMPETVYGGTLDVNTGALTVERSVMTFTGNEDWNPYYVSSNVRNVKSWILEIASINITSSSDGKEVISDRWKTSDPELAFRTDSEFVYSFESGNVAFSVKRDTAETLDNWKEYLSVQYHAGTPVQICYQIANPYTIQLTPQQIAALSGMNTIQTDADGVIVTGAEDPKHTITELKNAIISLGGNV